jgi:GT2 family glycosyltransferase
MISVVIILKNDLGIVNTIKELNDQDFSGKFEIVVVDRSTMVYPKIISKVPLRWIKYDPKGKRYTIPEQRNVGVKEAKGDIVVFLDANCIPKNDWLTKMVEPIINENENIVFGVTQSTNEKSLNNIPRKKYGHNKYVTEAWTNNLAFKTKILDKIGYFDETFDYGSDAEFSWRSINAGYKIRLQPEAISFHDWGDTNEELKRSILYGKARARLYLKHYKTHWMNLFGKDSPVLLYPVLILGLPITLVFPWYLLVFPILILKNIKEQNPFGVLTKHLFYGWGILIELKNQALNKLFPNK